MFSFTHTDDQKTVEWKGGWWMDADKKKVLCIYPAKNDPISEEEVDILRSNYVSDQYRKKLSDRSILYGVPERYVRKFLGLKPYRESGK